jgi:Zn-dependent peptidase ImmA (M78 family)
METRFKASIVLLILEGSAEKALELLAEHYGVSVPRVRVGLPKGRKKKAFGCYTNRNSTISVLNSDTLKDPFVIVHEFYHHLRTTVDLKHRGTERNADEFAKSFLYAYRLIAARVPGNHGEGT